MSEKKVNTTIKVKCDSLDSAQAFFGYVNTYKNDICNSINTALRSRGLGMTDATFEDVNPEKFTMKLSISPSDKGQVIILDVGGLSIVDYDEVYSEAFYGYIDGSLLVVFQKFDDEVDRSITKAVDMVNLAQLLDIFPKQYAEQVAAQKQAEANAEEAKAEEGSTELADDAPKVESEDAEPMMEIEDAEIIEETEVAEEDNTPEGEDNTEAISEDGMELAPDVEATDNG